MKMVIIGIEITLLCMPIHFQEGIKMQCKQMETFPEAFICGNTFYIFSTVISLIVSKALQFRLCFTLRYVTAHYECENNKSEVF